MTMETLVKEENLIKPGLKKIKMKIDKDIISKTHYCKKGFECLKNPRVACCKVTHCIDNIVCFIEMEGEEKCIYRNSFQDSFICCCPTRKEIYNKYGL